MPSQNTSSGGSTSGGQTSKNYASSVASTSTTSTSSTATSYTKEPVQDSGSKSSKKNTKRTTAILNSAKRLLSELGEPPTAAYDRQQAAANGGKQSGPSRNDFYMPNQMPPRS